ADPAPANASQEYVVRLTVIPIFLSAAMTMLALWMAPSRNSSWRWWYWPLIGAAIYGFSHMAGVVCRIATISGAKPDATKFSTTQAIYIPATAFISGAIGGLLLVPLDRVLVIWKSLGHGFAHALTFGPALFVAAFLLTGTLHIGFMKVLIEPEEQ